MEQKSQKQKRGGGPHMQAQFCRLPLSADIRHQTLQPLHENLHQWHDREFPDLEPQIGPKFCPEASNFSDWAALCLLDTHAADRNSGTIHPLITVANLLNPLYTNRHPTDSAPLENSGMHLPMKAQGYNGLRQHQGWNQAVRTNSSSISELLPPSSHPRQNVLTQDAPQSASLLTSETRRPGFLPPSYTPSFFSKLPPFFLTYTLWRSGYARL